jgi:hypothetical protein
VLPPPETESKKERRPARHRQRPWAHR